jgi:hypothetical protein
MFEYATVFFKRLFGQDPFGPAKPKPKKYKFKEQPKNKEKVYVKPKPKEKESYLELSYPGPNISGIIAPLIPLVIMIYIFFTIYPAIVGSLNMTTFGPATESMVGAIPLILIAVVAMGTLTVFLRVM